MTNLDTNLGKAQSFFNQMATKIDSNSPFCSMLGINNVVDSAAAFKRRQYAESMTELMKAALKWTMISAVCIGMHKLTSRPVVYVNENHQRALNELNSGDQTLQTIPPGSEAFLNDNFSNHSYFRRWDQSGKEYVAKCLESNSLVASLNTGYFMDKALEKGDSSLEKEVLKTCSSAHTSTQSCLTAKKTLNANKIVKACKTNQNEFCQQARNTAVDTAMQNKAWDQIIKSCLNAKTPAATCNAAVNSLEAQLTIKSEKTWKMAKKIDAKCKKSQHPICKKAQSIVFKETVSRSKWPETPNSEILRMVKTLSRNPIEGSAAFIEGAASAFVDFIESKDTKMTGSFFNLWFELKYPYRHNSLPSTISMAITLANACTSKPFPVSAQNAQAIVAFLEKHKTNIQREVDYWGYRTTYGKKSYLEELVDIFDAKITELNKAIPKLTQKQPKEPSDQQPKTQHVFDPQNPQDIFEQQDTSDIFGEQGSLPAKAEIKKAPKKDYRFTCTKWTDRIPLMAVGGKDNMLEILKLRDGEHALKEDEVDWESCGVYE